VPDRWHSACAGQVRQSSNYSFHISEFPLFQSVKSIQLDYNPEPRYLPIPKNGHFLSSAITVVYVDSRHVDRKLCKPGLQSVLRL